MLTLNPNTKRAQSLVKTAMHFDGVHLYDVYDRYSRRKLEAYHTCRDLCDEEGGDYFHICSYNGFAFSVAWFTDEGVRIETRDNSYFIPMENAKDKYIGW